MLLFLPLEEVREIGRQISFETYGTLIVLLDPALVLCWRGQGIWVSSNPAFTGTYLLLATLLNAAE